MAAVLPVGCDIAQRLLTDQRMQNVWSTLLRARGPVEDVSTAFADFNYQRAGNLRPLERLTAWDEDIDERSIPLAQQRCAAYLAYIAIEFTLERTVVTRAHYDELAKRFTDAAALTRLYANESAASMIEYPIGERAGPYVLKRSSGRRNDDKIRARVRALASGTQRIFGLLMYGTVATVATIALNTDVSERNVRNWCVGLSSH